MKDFLSDSRPFIMFYFSQIILMVIISQLVLLNTGGTVSVEVISYMLLLASSFLVIFLTYRYLKFRDFYVKRQNTYFPEPPNRMLANVQQLLENDHQQYQQEINALQTEKELEFNFIQQWVHQMKTPVSVMDLTLQKERMNLPENVFHSMQEEIEKLEQGLDQALYLSRLQKFDRDFHVQRLSLKQLVRESIQDFKSSFIRNSIFPEVTIEENCEVATDPKWIRFVINQLISNAIKYSNPNSEKIYFTGEQQEKSVTLTIRDTGCGIPFQDLSRVFDPFFTGLNGRKFRESTGMGLYLAHQICERLDYNITVQSAANKGTEVTLRFNTNLTNL
ncbi:sensor histidine kinase [Virgibacillus kekensis]|uniref:histidine kinase n=1 Tax=Virgibacillus kekensis TaxID=202261 RepID=A0ABV9DDL7_9BACI